MRTQLIKMRQNKKTVQFRLDDFGSTVARTHNSGFALWGLTCFAETFVQSSTFVLRKNSSAKNPPQRKAAKRYRK